MWFIGSMTRKCNEGTGKSEIRRTEKEEEETLLCKKINKGFIREKRASHNEVTEDQEDKREIRLRHYRNLSSEHST
jgi:hypothetical protein